MMRHITSHKRRERERESADANHGGRPSGQECVHSTPLASKQASKREPGIPKEVPSEVQGVLTQMWSQPEANLSPQVLKQCDVCNQDRSPFSHDAVIIKPSRATSLLCTRPTSHSRQGLIPQSRHDQQQAVQNLGTGCPGQHKRAEHFNNVII